MIGVLDKLGLVYFWGKIKTWTGNNYVAKESGKGLSTNDYTTAEKNKLNGIAAGAEANVQANWAETDSADDAFIKNKPTIPSKTSDLTNDSGFITVSEVPEGATASTSTPLMDGTAAVGSETAFARGDHRHPTDTTRQAVISDLATIRNGASAGATAYQKPEDGIPENDLASAIQTKLTAATNAIPASQKGTANGVCPLNSSSKIDSTYLPSYVDDVIEAYARSGQTPLSQNWLATGSASGTVISPESGKIYVLMNDVTSGNDVLYSANSQFRWATNTYTKLNDGGITAITNAEIDQITAN